jgi:CHAT domain-containing protein
VCHGTLEAKKPFDAGFELHSNERLTLLNIVQSRLPAAEFAFLSACHTAELAGPAPCRSNAVLWIPERGRDNVGDGKRG